MPYALLEIGDLGEDADYDLVVGTSPRHSPEPRPDLLLDQATLSNADAALRDFPDRAAADMLFITSTTGTTGRPKLVAQPFGRFEDEARRNLSPVGPGALEETYRHLRPGERVMRTVGDVSTPGVYGALRALSAGATHVRFERNVHDCLRLMNIVQVSHLTVTPHSISEMLDVMEAERIRCPSVKTLVMSGSLFARALLERIERAFDADIYVAYGSSETGPIARGRIAAATFREGYVGELAPNFTLISAGSRDNPAALVIAGAALQFSPHYARGKLTYAPATVMTLPDNGYLESGRVFLTGRGDEVANVSGNKTAFSVIESDLRSAPGVRDVAVIAAHSVGDSGGVIVAVVSSAAGDLDELVARVCRVMRLPGERHSAVRLFRMERIPRNATGKVDRGAIAKAYEAARKSGT